jgi:threonine dehydratase
MSSRPTAVPAVTLYDIQSAQSAIAARIIRTPLLLSDAASEAAGLPVYLKLENLQRTGAFKVRGALNKLSSLTSEQRNRGVICASSGNHGLGVAYASACFGVKGIVVLPDNANPHKLSMLKRAGAEVVTYGTTSDARQQKVDELSQQYGYTQVHPFADPVVIAGQGTIGLEILADLPEFDELYVPIGGGGLISGIAVAIKELRPSTRVYGVEPKNSNALWEALRHKRPFALPTVDTIADGLAARITEQVNYSLVSRFVDDIILVSDREIVTATLFLLENAKVMVEPSGAASFAGLLANAKRRGKVVAILSGGNISLRQMEELRGKTLGN